MPPNPETMNELLMNTVLISVLVLTILSVSIIWLVLFYQRRKYRHELEVASIRESFKREQLQSKIEIQEQTLQHIAREIHDNLGQSASVVLMGLRVLEPQLPEKAKEKLEEIRVVAKQLMAEIKSISLSLHGERIAKLGFEAALEDEIQRLSKSGLYRKVELIKEGPAQKLEPGKEIILFRMCQEILSNITKHADAETISVHLYYTPEKITLRITDDGKGFNVADKLENGLSVNSTGLNNLFTRAKLIEATLSYNSAEGTGTDVLIEMIF
jgi:signal transduction histidine kinase